MTCVGQLDNSRCISEGAAVTVEGVYFEVWTSKYELQQVTGQCLPTVN